MPSQAVWMCQSSDCKRVSEALAWGCHVVYNRFWAPSSPTQGTQPAPASTCQASPIKLWLLKSEIQGKVCFPA